MWYLDDVFVTLYPSLVKFEEELLELLTSDHFREVQSLVSTGNASGRVEPPMLPGVGAQSPHRGPGTVLSFSMVEEGQFRPLS